MSYIIPVHKKNDKCSLDNYHPVFLLPTCGKMFEKTIFNDVFYSLNIITYLLLINLVLSLMSPVSISFYQFYQLFLVFTQILVIIHYFK